MSKSVEIITIIFVIFSTFKTGIAQGQYLTEDTTELGKTSFIGVFSGYPTINVDKEPTEDDTKDTTEIEIEKLSYIEMRPDGSQKLHKLKKENGPKLKELKLTSSKTSHGNKKEEEKEKEEKEEKEQNKDDHNRLLRRLLHIFLPDGRIQITSSTNTPYAQTGQVTFSGGLCSGTLIGPRHVLTAGHCVHSGGSNGDWFNDFKFCPGRLSSSCSTWYSYSIVYTTNGWFYNGDFDYDMALIILTTSPNKGWLSFGYSSSITTTWDFLSHGYPSDKSPGTMWTTGCRPSATKTQTIEDKSCDFIPGQSGSHVYYTNNLVTYGIGSHEYAINNVYTNVWTRIESSKFALLCSLINDTNVC